MKLRDLFKGFRSHEAVKAPEGPRTLVMAPGAYKPDKRPDEGAVYDRARRMLLDRLSKDKFKYTSSHVKVPDVKGLRMWLTSDDIVGDRLKLADATDSEGNLRIRDLDRVADRYLDKAFKAHDNKVKGRELISGAQAALLSKERAPIDGSEAYRFALGRMDQGRRILQDYAPKGLTIATDSARITGPERAQAEASSYKAAEKELSEQFARGQNKITRSSIVSPYIDRADDFPAGSVWHEAMRAAYKPVDVETLHRIGVKV